MIQRETLGATSGWFPQIHSDESNDMRIWLSRRSRMLLIQIILMATILFTNFGLTVFAVSQFGSSNGVGLIYDGDCDTVRALDLWAHLLINLLSTGMLSASNYCMQLLAAPTRADVERADNDGKWLDIGGMQDAVVNDEYEELDVTACFRLYEDYWAHQGNAVILVANESVQMPADDSLLMSEVFVYRRQGDEAPFAQIPTPPQKPVVHISQPNGQDATFQRPKRRNTSEDASDNGPANHLPTTTATGSTSTVSAPEPRRFHLSRPDAMLSASEYPTPTHGGVSKKRSAPALFVERRIKRLSSRTTGKLQSTPDTATAQDVAPTSEQNVSGSQSTASASGGTDVGEAEPRKYKKPGVARLAGKGAAPEAKTQLPQSMTNRWNVDMDRMAEEMNAFALEQIGLNLQKAEEEQKQRLRSPTGGQSTSQLKYKPKAPTKRYSERHPESAPQGAAESADKEMTGPDVGLSETDDEEYVIETYIRVPASKMGDNVPPQNVGLLVFDEEPDIAYFYGEGSDSEDEWAEDEEDENAENYYTADYPDDEVASDDEYDMNAYAYRTGNASDLEEYDIEDEYDDPAYDSDDVKGGFKTYIGRNGFTTNHL
ncbi:hypothetical protein DL765_004709 [Monosporascus sp. GIB2]|nr:hypothetical protein DL765_004709 [Monosporascus sp. GIB2]